MSSPSCTKGDINQSRCQCTADGRQVIVYLGSIVADQHHRERSQKRVRSIMSVLRMISSYRILHPLQELYPVPVIRDEPVAPVVF